MSTRTVSTVLQRVSCKGNDRNAKNTTKCGRQRIHLVRKAVATAAMMLLIISCLLRGLSLRGFAEPDDKNCVVVVKAGDWAKYDFTHVSILSGWENDWTEVEIQNVSGTNVTIHVSTRYPVSDDRMECVDAVLSVDVKENWIEKHHFSAYDLSYGMPYVIAGNLSFDDYAFNDLLEKLSTSRPTFSKNYSLNHSVVSRKYGEAVREVLLINQSFELTSLFEYGMKVYDEFCWDRVTGLLLERNSVGDIHGNTNNVDMAYFMRITDTNLWKMTQSSTPWLQVTLGTALPIVAIMLVVTIQRNRNNKKQEDLENS